MLATSGPLPEDEDRWAFEPKWDGFRALVHADGRRLRVVSRRGTDLAGRLPELGPLAGVLRPGTTLDGELVVFDHEGRVDFDGMRRRGFGQPSAGRLAFLAFDVLAITGEEVMARRWEARRAILVELGLDGPAWRTTPSYLGDGAVLLDATRTQGIEGVVAKRLDSLYRPGVRTTAWVKTKHFDRAWFEVLGVAPTSEGRAALVLGTRRSAGQPARYAGRVEWGFSRERFEELITRARPADVAPFEGAVPPDMLCLKGVRAEVRYLAGSQLRHATLMSLAFPDATPGRTGNPPQEV